MVCGVVVVAYKKLYWGSAFNANRGACVIATSAREARKLFATLRGYYAVDVEAKRLCRLPLQHQTTSEIYPSDSLLEDCGLEIVKYLCPGTKEFCVVRRMLKGEGRILRLHNLFLQEGFP